jgi:hypothetical protein
MTTKKEIAEQEALEKSKVGMLGEENLSLTNQLNIYLQINKIKKEELNFQKQLKDLGRSAVIEANKYERVTKEIKQLEKELVDAKRSGNKDSIRFTKNALEDEQKKQTQLKATAGGALKAMEHEAKKRKDKLTTEQKLIEGTNKERAKGNALGSIGVKVTDLFRSKESKQKSIDLARAKSGGGTNTGQAVDASKGLGESLKQSAVGKGFTAMMGGLAAGATAAMGPVKELGNQMKSGLTASLAGAANLLTGEDYGMGGGKANASGATSILGGLSSILKTIPFIGGILGGVVDMFKAMLDAVLGIEQANFRVGRALNISAEAADKMRDHFIKVGKASDNIVVNDARMFQSLVEINKQLGTNLQIRDDILVNDVKLRDILGLEVESRKVLSDQALATGRDARELTKSAIGTVGAFNKLVGTSFKFSDILGEASKLAGVMGLTLTKYPEKIYKAITATKALGFDLKQLDGTAQSFLDFEGSISKEMEAQVLTGKDMNLTLAREAALNNDNVTLAKEITKNVGSANAYLKMNRIQQEAIAQSVGLSRDGLADILKKQVIYNRAGVEDEKGLVRKLDLLEKQGVQQKEISRILGEDGYKTATQVSTAEQLSEIMERIKRTFVEFIKSSGLFEFMTDPAKINNFIKGLADKLASTISMIGEIIATMLEGVSHLPFTDTDKWQGLAASVRMGSGGLAGSIRATTDSLGGAPAGSISGNVEKGTKQENNYKAKASTATTGVSQPIQNNIYVTVDEMAMAKASTNNMHLIPGQTQG